MRSYVANCLPFGRSTLTNSIRHTPCLTAMLTDRITLSGPVGDDPEDYLNESLAVIFPDDITNQHGDTEHQVIYTSPSLGEIQLALADPQGEDNRRLFSHFLWNAGVQLAALIEDGEDWKPEPKGAEGVIFGEEGMWDVKGKRVLEVGAGTGLAGIIAARCGARETTITDYPAPEVLANISINAARNCKDKEYEKKAVVCSVRGHEWGQVGADFNKAEGPESRVEENKFTAENEEAFDRILVADCLWMPWQHRNLMKSIRWFLAPGAEAWVVAGFHTGRPKMAGFFDAGVLAEEGLEIKTIWERSAEGFERSWVADRGMEDVTTRKRWLVIAVFKRTL